MYEIARNSDKIWPYSSSRSSMVMDLGVNGKLFWMVTSLTPKTSPSPKMRFYMPPRYANGHISATGNPIHFMFPSRVVFLESADRIFPVTADPSWIISNCHISATTHSTNSAIRAFIFATAQFSCIFISLLRYRRVGALILPVIFVCPMQYIAWDRI